ncbi:MAG: hypothetical protein JWN75_1177 [Candidatus Saccharibacteria bacterium]|nr:hypothetical protein [Candidatus Saccharibacteria bacterium]
MKLRIIVEEDGSKRLQYSEATPDWWVDVPEVPAAEEYDFSAEQIAKEKRR